MSRADRRYLTKVWWRARWVYVPTRRRYRRRTWRRFGVVSYKRSDDVT